MKLIKESLDTYSDTYNYSIYFRCPSDIKNNISNIFDIIDQIKEIIYDIDIDEDIEIRLNENSPYIKGHINFLDSFYSPKEMLKTIKEIQNDNDTKEDYPLFYLCDFYDVKLGYDDEGMPAE